MHNLKKNAVITDPRCGGFKNDPVAVYIATCCPGDSKFWMVLNENVLLLFQVELSKLDFLSLELANYKTGLPKELKLIFNT